MKLGAVRDSLMTREPSTAEARYSPKYLAERQLKRSVTHFNSSDGIGNDGTLLVEIKSNIHPLYVVVNTELTSGSD